MTKAELERERSEYHSLLARSRQARDEGRYDDAVHLARSACHFIDGMMQYERKYENREFDTVEAIEIVFTLAPLLFDYECLDAIEAILKNQRRIEKNTTADLADRLSNARALMWDAHRLWTHIEQHAEVRQDELRRNLGGDQDRWRNLAESWHVMGLIRRIPEQGSYRLSLVTQMDAVIRGKCPTCGAVGKAARLTLLEAIICPKCQATVMFVFLRQEPTGSS